jgi:hypothetical protein
VFTIQLAQMGGLGNGQPQRQGYWQIKWLAHAMKAANSHLPRWPDGSPKMLDDWTYVENLKP